MASTALAETPPIRLKGRTFAPAPNVHAARTPARRSAPGPAAREYLIVQFERAPAAADLARLRQAGAVPLRYVPEHAVAVSAVPGFDPSTVAGVRWSGALTSPDRLSTDARDDLARERPRYPLMVVEFQPDVTAAEVSDALAAAGTARAGDARVRPHVAVIPNDRVVVERLAANPSVAWVYPATTDVLSARQVCSGLLAPAGIVAEYALVGDGWDGPGRGASDLGYHLLRPTADVAPALTTGEVVRALAEWSRHIAVTWRAGGAGDARTLTILWGPPDHGDGYPFAPEVLAHAFHQAPHVPEPIAGDVHFNESFDWGVADASRYDIFTVMLHETGHSLGLGHTSDPDTVMYPMYQGATAGLRAGDVDAARQLYAPAGPGLSEGWQNSAIGSVARSSASEHDGVITLEATGRDIWGTADELTFVARPLDGDGDIIARVDSLAAVHAWSKAGVMVRASSSAISPHAFLLVSGGRGLAFQRRRVSGGISTHTDGGAGTAPRWLWLSRRGDRFEAYVAADGGAWQFVGADTVAMGSRVLAGLALTSHDPAAVAAASFSSVSVTAQPRWQNVDIGAVGAAGSSTATAAGLRVVGSGADIWNAADAFHFAWRPLTGDGEIIARVASVQYTDRWSKAGVMIRASLGADAPHAFMLVSPGKGYAFQRRPTQGGLSLHTAAGSGTAPQWVRLRRQGNLLSAYRSDDGISWVLVGSEQIAMGETVLAGLAVSSHVAGATCAASFERIEIRR